MVVISNLSWQANLSWQISALKERQCTPKERARYVNVRGSVHWKGVYKVGDRDLGVQDFFNWFLKLTNQKRPKVTCLVRH